VEQADDLVDCNVLDARDVVLVAKDEEFHHEIPVVPGAE
jgi:hypothetical protein